MEYHNGPSPTHEQDYDIAPEDFSPPPSVVRRNVVLEGQLNIWHELRKYDQSNTGLITAADFRQALDNLGIRFGSRPADKILVLMKFTPDGMVDYLKLGEEVEAFMRTHGSPKPPRRDTANMFTITPRLTTDPEPLPDEREKSINLKTKERVFAVQDRIYEAFCAYEREEISSDRFLDIIQELGIQPTTATVRVLRRRDEVGSCSYANLIQALCLLEERPAEMRASPVRSPWQSPGRSPIKDNGPAPQHKVRLMTLPPSLRDSNVISWSDDPKREKTSAKATTTRRFVCEDVVNYPSRYVQENYDPEITPTEIAYTKQEKVYAMVRDFIEGAKTALEFRTALRDIGIEINRELEQMISRHDRDGQMKFQDFIKILNLYHEGDIRYTYTEETIIPRATANIFDHHFFDAPNPPPPSNTLEKPLYMRGTPDITKWVQENGEPIIDNDNPPRPPSPTKRFDSSKDFAVWETDSAPPTNVGTNDPLGRPNTPKRHYTHANSSRLNDIMKWEKDEKEQLQQTQPPEQPQRRLLRSVPTTRQGSSENILTWNNTNQQPQRMKSPDRTHAVLPNGLLHPKAPFGTERDQYYNINPHRQYQEAERKQQR